MAVNLIANITFILVIISFPAFRLIIIHLTGHYSFGWLLFIWLVIIHLAGYYSFHWLLFISLVIIHLAGYYSFHWLLFI